MANLFDALEYVLENEGGFSNHPNDRGGATKYGITSVLLSAYLQRVATLEDVQNLDEERAQAIYEKEFWNPLRLSEVDDQMIATAIFDIAVNMGPVQAMKLTQAAINDVCVDDALINKYGPPGVGVDGKMGDETLRYLNSLSRDHFIKVLRVKMLAKYSDIVAKIPEQRVFLNGWTKRADRLLTLV